MKKVPSNVDFADSEYKFCKTNERELIIFLNSWENKIIEIKFLNPIQFFYRGGSVIAGIYEKSNSDPFLLEALSSYYEQIPKDHPFKLFALIDIEDHPLFEIIAEKVFISLIKEN